MMLSDSAKGDKGEKGDGPKPLLERNSEPTSTMAWPLSPDAATIPIKLANANLINPGWVPTLPTLYEHMVNGWYASYLISMKVRRSSA
jgi:hypothetical protein